jgi:hypothetical protein
MLRAFIDRIKSKLSCSRYASGHDHLAGSVSCVRASLFGMSLGAHLARLDPPTRSI